MSSNENTGHGNASKISIEDLYTLLAKYIGDYEKDLSDSINEMSGKKGNEVDQSMLLRIQTKIQTWSTIVSTSSGIIRAIGDGLKATAQNIR